MPDSWKTELQFYVDEHRLAEHRLKQAQNEGKEAAHAFAVNVLRPALKEFCSEWNAIESRYTSDSVVMVEAPFETSLTLFVDAGMVFQLKIKTVLSSTGAKVKVTVGNPNGTGENPALNLPSYNAKELKKGDLIQIILSSLRMALQARISAKANL